MTDFVKGLQPEIKLQILSSQKEPQNMSEALQIASRWEQLLQDQGKLEAKSAVSKTEQTTSSNKDWRDKSDTGDRRGSFNSSTCNFCNKKGHTEDTCYSKNPGMRPKLSCNICRQEGHSESRCPNKNRNNSDTGYSDSRTPVMTTNEDTRVRFNDSRIAAVLSAKKKETVTLDKSQEKRTRQKKTTSRCEISLVNYPGTKNNLGVYCQIQGTSVIGLLDGGSSVSAVKKSWWEDNLSDHYELETNEEQSLFSISDNRLEVVGKAMLKVQIGEQEYLHPFLVVENINSDVLIGVDFQVLYNALIHTKGKKMMLEVSEDVSGKGLRKEGQKERRVVNKKLVPGIKSIKETNVVSRKGLTKKATEEITEHSPKSRSQEQKSKLGTEKVCQEEERCSVCSGSGKRKQNKNGLKWWMSLLLLLVFTSSGIQAQNIVGRNGSVQMSKGILKINDFNHCMQSEHKTLSATSTFNGTVMRYSTYSTKLQLWNCHEYKLDYKCKESWLWSKNYKKSYKFLLVSQQECKELVLKFNSNSKGFQRMGKDKYILKNHDQVSLQLGENSLTRE